ncbi:MAG: hypothetical protein GY953_27660, partial [bacterium]|nr:hypothetical protein [bacterium]
MKRILSTLAALSTGSTLVFAQASGESAVEPPTKLAEFRDAFEKASTTRSAPAKAAFATALEQLARTRAQSGDYLGAIRARDRRLELLASDVLEPITPIKPEGEIVVDLARGSRTGSGLKYDSKGTKVVGFDKTSQAITWDLSNTKPGEYSAHVTYSCGESYEDKNENIIRTGGIFTLSEATGLSTTTSSQPLRRTVLSTGGWNKSVTRNIGKITVTGSLLTLELKVAKAAQGGLMHLYGIRLVPVAPTGNAGAS